MSYKSEIPRGIWSSKKKFKQYQEDSKMRKIFLWIFIAVFPFVLSADFGYGPKINCYGKQSDTGLPLNLWFNPNSNNSFSIIFNKENKEMIEWEIEKMFKIHIFKMDFFERSYVNVDLAASYIMTSPEVNKKFVDLAGRYCLLYQSGGNDNNGISKLQYVLLKSEGSWKSKVENSLRRHMSPRNIKKIINKYDKQSPAKPRLTTEQLKEKECKHNIAFFNRTTFINSDPSAGGIASWNRLDVIRDVLKGKVITTKNLNKFTNLVNYSKLTSSRNFTNRFNPINSSNSPPPANTMPDDIVNLIIKYFRLNTKSPIINVYSLKMLGKNPKLDKALLKNFNNIKRPQYPSAYYTGASLVLNKPVDKISSASSLVYARVTGNYNRAFELATQAPKQQAIEKYERQKREWDEFLKPNSYLYKSLLKRKDAIAKKYLELRRKSLDNPGWRPSKMDYNYLRAAIPLLEKGSNLNMQAASEIINKLALPNYLPELQADKRFSKLLKAKHLKSKDHHLPFGACFPFESLSATAKKQLFKTYTRILKYPKAHSYKKMVLDRILAINDPQYKLKAIEFLLAHPFRESNKILDRMSLKYLPELQTIAGNDDLRVAIRACELIGRTSLLGHPAGPALKELLKTRNDFTIRIALICALAEIKDKSSIPLIKKYCKNKNRLLARAAKQAVYLLQPVNEEDIYFQKMLRTNPKIQRMNW